MRPFLFLNSKFAFTKIQPYHFSDNIEAFCGYLLSIHEVFSLFGQLLLVLVD